jgi:predicted permease
MLLSTTLLPIALVILLGLVLKRNQFVSDQFWKEADRMVYYVFFPCLLISKIASMDLSEVEFFKISSIIVIVLLLLSFLLIILQYLKPVEAATFTSIYQGAIRFNTFVTLSVIASIWDTPLALEVAALIVGIKVLLLNILCVGIFTIYIKSTSSTLEKISLTLKNPLIISCCTGLLLNWLGVSLPAWLFASMDLLGKVALPLGLLSVGAGLVLRYSDWLSYPILLSTIFKLLIAPFVAFFLGQLFGLDTISHQVMVLLFAMPTAISAYILAGQLGGDQVTMAKIITIQTVISAATLSLILLWIANSTI